MWNQSWGDMIWGATGVAVPAISALGLLLLGLAMLILAVRRAGTGPGAGRRVALYVAPLVFLAGGIAWAEAVSLPHTFVNGTRADALQVNANFNALAQAVNRGRSVVIESEFQATRATAQIVMGLNGGGAAITNGPSEPFASSFVAPTHVPADASITRIDFYHRDTDASLNIELCLFSYSNSPANGYVNFGCVNSVGAPGTTVLSLTPSPTPQTDRFFELRVRAVDAAGNPLAWPGTTLQARGAFVSYQFD
jgi:hypothetical protein